MEIPLNVCTGIDEDTLFALQLQASEYDIFNENAELFDNLVKEFTNNNHEDIDDMLSKTFRTTFIDNPDFGIAFSEDEDEDSLLNDLEQLDMMTYSDECELINENSERLLRQQITTNLTQNITQNNQQSITNQIALLNGNFGSGVFGNIGNGVFGSINNILGMIGSEVNIETVMNGLNGIFAMEPVQVTLTPEALNQLDEITYEEVKEHIPEIDAEEQCSICLDKLIDKPEDHKYTILPCNHIFHSNCIKEYLKDYDYHCPICKSDCGEHKPKIDGNSSI